MRRAPAARPAIAAVFIPWLVFAAGISPPAIAQESPRTRPERTGFEETSRYVDVIAFLDSLRPVDRSLDVRSFGYSEEDLLGRVFASFEARSK